ncbi:MAG: ParB/RepB/Spo0J family partition protein [Clostridiales bacterium]|nr:ParB/RepB/Spo0J family partition protein [Clostridiales bacterium]
MARRVSRGISQLLANAEDVREVAIAEDKILMLPIDKVVPNPNQPRKNFAKESLKELSDSILEHGIIQPLVVKKEKSHYMIIAGERRFRAAKEANLTEVPVIVRQMDEKKVKETSLIENLQREDLNAIEEAEAIKELMKSYNLTQEDVAKQLGKARPSIANTLRLLTLSEQVQQMVRDNLLSAGHARTLVPVTNQEDQIELAQKAIIESWSVREMEKRVKYYLKPETEPKKLTDTVRQKLSLEMREFVNDMTRVFATKVKLMGNETKGRITIDYYSNDDLQRIYEIIDSLKK